MTFNWRGKSKNIKELPKGNLPKNAHKFKEPSSLITFSFVGSLTLIPVILMIMGVNQLKTGTFIINPYDDFNTWAIVFACISIIFHEILHGLAFPKEAVVDFWYSPKHLMAFVHSTDPMSKNRFIWMSLLPTLVLGGIPYLLWLVLPLAYPFMDFLFTFSFFSILIGCGDFLNVFNAFFQMPKGTYTQMSGFHSYWFERKELKKKVI